MMTSSPLDGRFRSNGDAVIVDLEGDLNGMGKDRLDAIYSEATSQNPSRIVINFTGVHYIDSMGISLIVGLLSEARKSERQLFAYGLTDHYTHIFEITRLTDYIPIFENEQKALESISTENQRN